MGIQINGQSDSISAGDGSLSINAEITSTVLNQNVTGVTTFTDVEFTSGVNVSGVVTASTGLNVGVTTFHSTSAFVHDVKSTGVITATSFSGDGSSLSGIDATTLKDSGGTIRVQANTSGAVVSGMITVGNSFIKDEAVGLGTTSTAGRDAGISTAPGTIIYNETLGSVQVYKRITGWNAIDDTGDSFLSMGYLVVAGGGGGSDELGGGGGGGGFREATNYVTPYGSFTITVGAGGAGGVSSPNLAGAGSPGGNSVFGSIVASGGGGGQSCYGGEPNGQPGGSGGGGSGENDSAFSVYGSGQGGAGNAGGHTPVEGYPGGSGQNAYQGGGGGGAGGAGDDGEDNNDVGNGGIGRASTILPAPIATSRSVGEVSSGAAYFGGGGGGGDRQTANAPGSAGGGAGGLGGGGDGGGLNYTASPGTVNTGGGGGSEYYSGGGNGHAGGSGVVVLKVPNTTTVTFSGGVTQTSNPDGNHTLYVVTATSTSSETVTISK